VKIIKAIKSRKEQSSLKQNFLLPFLLAELKETQALRVIVLRLDDAARLVILGTAGFI